MAAQKDAADWARLLIVSCARWAQKRNPEADAALAEFSVPSLSFPSGHASMAAIVFLTLGALLASTRTSRIERVYLLSTAATFAVLIGLSRVLLGVHWATDVLGGWAFGAAWAMAWLLVARFAERRDS